MKQAHNIVTMGGGSGQHVLLSGLRELEKINITAIVSMADSGGSTGRLRCEFGTLPPGDILKCILALSPHNDVAYSILLKRFTTHDRLIGHNAGNMLLTMLSQYTGSFAGGVQALSEIFDVRGTILPVSTDKATLVAKLDDGTHIYGEKAIDIPEKNHRENIKDLFLVPHYSDSVSVYPPVIKAIHEADYIIIGPGDLFTSIIPNLIVPGMKEALHNTKARILYVNNIMTKFGETHHFAGYNFVKKIEEVIQMKVKEIIYNTEKPDKNILQKYLKEKSVFVRIDKNDEQWNDYTVYMADLLETHGGVVRHDSKRLAALIENIILEGAIQ